MALGGVKPVGGGRGVPKGRKTSIFVVLAVLATPPIGGVKPPFGTPPYPRKRENRGFRPKSPIREKGGKILIRNTPPKGGVFRRDGGYPGGRFFAFFDVFRGFRHPP